MPEQTPFAKSTESPSNIPSQSVLITTLQAHLAVNQDPAGQVPAPPHTHNGEVREQSNTATSHPAHPLTAVLPAFNRPQEAEVNQQNVELALWAAHFACSAAQLIRTTKAKIGDVSAHTNTKSSPVDPVTTVDLAAEEHLLQLIKTWRGEDGFLGEEGSSFPGTSGLRWIVDPIDGTVNFTYNRPQYAVSVAVAKVEQVLAGAVINVATGELYVAAHGFGAIKYSANTFTPLPGPKAVPLELSLVGTGFAYTALRRSKQAQLLLKLLPEIRDIRRLGSAALDLCALAEGHIDAFYEHGLHPWDYAAGSLIAQESGAIMNRPLLDARGLDGEATIGGSANNIEELSTIVGGKLPE